MICIVLRNTSIGQAEVIEDLESSMVRMHQVSTRFLKTGAVMLNMRKLAPERADLHFTVRFFSDKEHVLTAQHRNKRSQPLLRLQVACNANGMMLFHCHKLLL